MLNDTKLQRVNEYVDLGVPIDGHLSWNSHVRKVVSKVNQVIGLIKWSLDYTAPVSARKKLYAKLVRRNVEYLVIAGLSKSLANAIIE